MIDFLWNIIWILYKIFLAYQKSSTSKKRNIKHSSNILFFFFQNMCAVFHYMLFYLQCIFQICWYNSPVINNFEINGFDRPKADEWDTLIVLRMKRCLFAALLASYTLQICSPIRIKWYFICIINSFHRRVIFAKLKLV